MAVDPNEGVWTHGDPNNPGAWAGKICRCAYCGTESRCTPENDFYRLPANNKLVCEPCFVVCCHNAGLPTIGFPKHLGNPTMHLE